MSACLVIVAIASCGERGDSSAPGGASGGSSTINHTELRVDPAFWRPLPPAREVLAPRENNARIASEQSRFLNQSFSDDRTRRAVRLHEALFAAAYEFAYDEGLWSPSLGLQPPDEAPRGIDPHDYFLRVLASLIEKSPSLSWIAADDASAALLKINLLGEDARGEAAQAEISVVLPRGTETGRTAQARWDESNDAWSLRFQPVTWSR